MTLEFPLNPVDGQVYSNDGRSWKFKTSKGVWQIVPVTQTDADYAAEKALEAHAAKADALAAKQEAEDKAAAAAAAAQQAEETLANAAKKTELQAADGTDGLGFQAAGSGAVPMTLTRKLTMRISLLDYVSDAVREQIAAKTVFPDVTAALALAVAAAVAVGGGDVELPVGGMGHTALFKVAPGVRVAGAGLNSVLKCLNAIAPDPAVPGGAHQGQSVWLQDRCSAQDFVVDGGDFDTGGFVVSVSERVTMRGLRVQNSGDVGSQAYNLFGAKDVVIESCSAERALHGIQAWGCDGVRITGNFVNRVVGGIWTAGSKNVVVNGNEVANCSDVGIDFEGGENCISSGNVVRRCKNGELAFFHNASGVTTGCIGLVHTGNKVHRTATYIERDGTEVAVDTLKGALWVSSLSPGARGCGFLKNDVLVDANAGRLWLIEAGYGTDTKEFSISQNTFTFYGTGQPFAISGQAPGLQHIDNTYRFKDAVAESGTFKNVKGGLIAGNKVKADVAPTAAAFYLYTDQPAQQSCFVSRNDFFGCGDKAMKVDLYVSGYGSYVLHENGLTQQPTLNGGLTVVTANGLPIYQNQRILLAEQGGTSGSYAVDFNALQCLSGPDALRPIADISYCCSMGGAQRNAYKLMYQAWGLYSMTGTGASSGAAASSAFYLSTSGSTATITKLDTTAPNLSYFELRLTSPYPAA